MVWGGIIRHRGEKEKLQGLNPHFYMEWQRCVNVEGSLGMKFAGTRATGINSDTSH